MPSPFPGMNPFLESEGVWHSFHQQFCIRCMEDLVPQVRPNYSVVTDEHVYVHELGGEERHLIGRPDAFVVENRQSSVAQGAGATLLAPVYSRVAAIAIDEEHVTFLKIVDRQSRDLVTVIELLSPTNKEKQSERAAYLAKRKHYLDANIGFVEIDLLRRGRRSPVEQTPECDYCAMVVRPGESPRVGIWPIMLSDPLPVIPVPLRPHDADAGLNLQTLLHDLYDAGGYGDYIYGPQFDPRLTPAQAQWAMHYVPPER